jgi:hypothetical protein
MFGNPFDEPDSSLPEGTRPAPQETTFVRAAELAGRSASDDRCLAGATVVPTADPSHQERGTREPPAVRCGWCHPRGSVWCRTRAGTARPRGSRRRRGRARPFEAVDVVGPSVQQQHRSTVPGADLDVADIEHACPDLFESIEHRTHRVRSVRNAARSSALNSAGCSQAAKWPPRSTSLKSSDSWWSDQGQYRFAGRETGRYARCAPGPGGCVGG